MIQPDSTPVIPTDDFSSALRAKAIRVETCELLITDFRGSDQEQDLTRPPNCGGFGRIRHFRRNTSDGWPENPLPIDPACNALGLPRTDILEAQVFQSSACNWRCWYCFVPFELLAAKESHAGWLTPADLVARYLAEPDRPAMIDLTGGQPDLTPEWVPWTMDALRDRGVEHQVYLWSDDNLSNDYYFRYLTEAQREKIAGYPMYGRVCCFKGFNATSFQFNTKAAPELFDRQFELFRLLLREGLDLYAYVTLTTPQAEGIDGDMARFVDRLQAVDPRLPLRTVPLEIQVFSPVAPRVKDTQTSAMRNQLLARDRWMHELECRFSSAELEQPVHRIKLAARGGGAS